MSKKKLASAKVASIRHKDKRKNIPTEELRNVVADEEQSWLWRHYSARYSPRQGRHCSYTVTVDHL
jgi:hypothetical protein